MYEIKNTGLLARPLSAADFVAGWRTALPWDPVNPSGDWRPYLPAYEPQAMTFDTMSCVSFSSLNCLEILHILNEGEQVNWSDRFTAVMSGTRPTGNTFREVWDSIRHHGVVPEETWPYQGKTWSGYMADVPERVRREGRKWHDRYDVGYEFLPNTADDTLREGLKRGPLQISIGNDTLGIQLHALVLTHLDPDGTRHVFDTYGTGKATMPPSRRIYAALRPYLAQKDHMTAKDISDFIDANENRLIMLTEEGVPGSGSMALIADGRVLEIAPDRSGQAALQCIGRGVQDGFVSVTKRIWDALPRQDF